MNARPSPRSHSGPPPTGDESFGKARTMPKLHDSFPAFGACLVLAAVLLAVPARDARADASEAKANLVSAFLQDVTIPSAVLAKSKGAPTFAVLGEDELALALTTVLSAIDLAGKPVFVKFVRKPADVAGAQVVFVSSSAYAQVAEALAASSGAITIADNPGFLGAGGMVSFSGGKLTVARAKLEAAGYKLGGRALASAQ